MRLASEYRGARRNALRAVGNLRQWRYLGAEDQANNRAKLKERRNQCYRAQVAVALLTGKTQLLALYDFWSKQKRTRVVSRILRNLKPQVQHG